MVLLHVWKAIDHTEFPEHLSLYEMSRRGSKFLVVQNFTFPILRGHIKHKIATRQSAYMY